MPNLIGGLYTRALQPKEELECKQCRWNTYSGYLVRPCHECRDHSHFGAIFTPREPEPAVPESPHYGPIELPPETVSPEPDSSELDTLRTLERRGWCEAEKDVNALLQMCELHCHGHWTVFSEAAAKAGLLPGELAIIRKRWSEKP